MNGILNIRRIKITDQAIKEQEIKKIIKYYDYYYKACPFNDCDSLIVPLYRIVGNERTRKCLKCGRIYRTKEYITQLW